ncbi:MAG: hypothetical protein H7039_09370 [Bryobacteraceae bacterium]|nr:hypothetical protein [Bryobacteraceae bacterium]
MNVVEVTVSARSCLLILLALLCTHAALAVSPASEYADSLRQAGLDSDACYRVRDLAFQKEDLRFYLTEGHLIFSKPVAGRRFAAMFTADIPGGDAEVLLFPPARSERLSLARFAKSPNLNEHFGAALFLFSDGTGEELLQQIESAEPKRLPEIGTAMASTFNETLRNLLNSYQTRLVQDHFSSRSAETGLFYAGINTRSLGNIDLVYDPRQRDQITVGQVVFRDERQFFDTWTSFPARSFRTGSRKTIPSSAKIERVRIDASLDSPDLRMKAVTTIEISGRADGDTAIPFELSRRVKILSAKVDGEPAEVFYGASLRSTLMRGSDNEVFLVVLPKTLRSGETRRIEFTHEGSVVSEAGNGVYFVGARMNWYPNRDAEFSTYEMTFRHPRNLSLVATGELISEKTEGDFRVATYKASNPIRFAGFNLGQYQRTKAVRAGVSLEVCANRSVESGLIPRRDLVIQPPAMPRSGRRPGLLIDLPAPAPSPVNRLDQMTSDIGGALEFMATHFGPPPLKTLSVSPIPGMFGQGFPGLLYLSTLAYLNPDERPMPLQTDAQRTFFSELLHAHETAHQWWGNLVTSPGYQDDWLMEAMANYSALLVLERKKGRRALDTVLEEYRVSLLRKVDGGQTIESTGPLIWGTRLQSSQSPGAWRPIIYEKGTWVLHMLRERLGDTAFLKLLGEIVKARQYSSLSTEEFRGFAARYLPAKSDDSTLESFFDTWVYNTGIPAIKVEWTVTGRAPAIKLKGSVTQSDVSDDFTASVPLDIQLPGRKTLRRWIATSGESTSFSIDLPAAPVKVNTDLSSTTLVRRRT